MRRSTNVAAVVADSTQSVLDRLSRPRICVLGGPRLHHDGDDTAVVGKPGRILAALVLRRHGVSVDQLLDIVWPDDPPKSARPALHVHLGAVRKLLASAPPGASIDRSGPRYRLRLDGWDVDIDLLEALVDEANGLDPAEASVRVRLLDAALQLWSSPPVTSDDPSVDSFESQSGLARLDAEEARIDALIAAGELGRAELIAVGMVDAEPYRERRWGQLMRIQAEQGRAADALRTFRTARRRIVDELGVEPGPELQAIERSVLTRGLVPPAAAVERTDELDPVPLAIGPLIGRNELVSQIESSLVGGPVELLGAPGVGKTRLALEIARRRHIWRSGVGWIDLRNAQFDHDSLHDRLLLWARDHPGGLAVIDNAESVVDVVSRAVCAVRRAAPAVGLLVTSRVPVLGDAATFLVDPLGLPATDHPNEIEASPAVRLFRSMLEALAPNAQVDAEVAALLVRRMGGLPLAIRLSVEVARTVPVNELVDRPGLAVASEIDNAVAAVLQQLDPVAQDAFASISVVAGPLDTSLITALSGDEAGSTTVVRHLVECGLVHYDASNVHAPYSVLEPLRDAAQRLLTPAQRAAALDRLVDHCTERGAQGSRLGTGTRDGIPLRSALARELTWHRQAVAYLAQIGDDQRALRLVAGLELPLYTLGWWNVNTELQDSALAIPGEPTPLRARVHAARGRPGLLHQLDEGHLTAAIAMAHRFDDLRVAGRASYQLGLLRWWQRAWDEALDLFDQARRMGERAGDDFIVIEARRFSGVAMVSAGDTDRGFAAQLDALRTVERTRGMELLAPHVRMYLGHCRRHVGDDAAALADLELSRDDYERVGNRASLIHIYGGLAELHADHGHTDAAERHAGRGLDLAAAGGITTYEPWLLATIARVRAHDGDATRARAAASAAAAALSKAWSGEIHRIAVELAHVCHVLGDFDGVARLVGVADTTEDRRELPFQTPAERTRATAACAAARGALGDAFEPLRQFGTTSTLTEALARLGADVH